MHRVLTDGGRLGASVYGPIENNPGTIALAQALDHHLGTGASQTKRAEHVLAYPSLVEKLAVDAGFADITLTTETKLVRLPPRRSGSTSSSPRRRWPACWPSGWRGRA